MSIFKMRRNLLEGGSYWDKKEFSGYGRQTWVKPEPKAFYQPVYTPQKSKRIGKRVYHESFGYGTVIRETPNGLEVHFDDVGMKKVQARFLSQV